jgi:hypothetical protein
MMPENSTYTVQLNAHGVIRFKTTCGAKPAGLVGDYRNGAPYQPDLNAAVLPYRYRKAFERALKWWQAESMSGQHMPLRCDLTTLRGQPMGTLFATPDWSKELER